MTPEQLGAGTIKLDPNSKMALDLLNLTR